jgi:hypothetical protein
MEAKEEREVLFDVCCHISYREAYDSQIEI